MRPLLLLVCALAFALGSAARATAQLYEPPPPTTKGLLLDAHLNGVRYGIETGFISTAPDGSVTDDASVDYTASGAGFGLGVGYGFGDVFTLYAGYDLSLVGTDLLEGVAVAATIDLGARFHLPTATPQMVPYVQASLSGFVLLDEDRGDGSSGFGGGGYTLGGGALYFLSERVALRGGVDATFGAYSTLFIDGEASDLGTEFDAATVRVQLGFAFYPFR